MQPLNFAAHCLDAFATMVGPVRREMPDLGLLMEHAMAVLRAAPKFQLPEGGRLVDGAAVERMLPRAKLPFPVVALEYPGVVEPHKLTQRQVKARKRITIVAELREGVPKELGQLGRGIPPGSRPALVVMCFYLAEPTHNEYAPIWTLVPGAIEIALDQSMIHGADAGLYDTGLRGVTPSPKELRTTLGLTAQSLLIPPSFAHGVGGLHEASQHVLADLNDEAWTAISFAVMTSCANVHIETSAAPTRLNQKREKAGKTPFFPVNFLTVGETGYVARKLGCAQAGSTHASPRTHLRRGHVRQLDDQRSVWIEATVVNPSAQPPVPRFIIRKTP